MSHQLVPPSPSPTLVFRARDGADVEIHDELFVRGVQYRVTGPEIAGRHACDGPLGPTHVSAQDLRLAKEVRRRR